MNEIELNDVSTEFARCWHAAGMHIQKQVQGPFRGWIRAHLNPPFLEHLSFRLGNQLFSVRIEDVEQKLLLPGTRDGLLKVSDGCNGQPCVMPMRYSSGDWVAASAGWGLLDFHTGEPIDPLALVSDERIEMSDWELQDFAVQVVRDHIEKTGQRLMSWQGNPVVDPSIWFVGESGPEWIVVRAVRYPGAPAEAPADWDRIAERCMTLGRVGYFASLVVANAEDAFHVSAPPLPLWRGHELTVRFDGLKQVLPSG